MNIKRISTSSFVLSLAAIAALPAAASDWTAWEGHSETSPLAIHTTDTNQHGVLLTCGANGKVAAMISLSPGDMPVLMSKNAPYGRSAQAEISVGAGDAVQSEVRYIPAIDSIEARSPSIAAKVFNAAVLGEPLTISVKRQGTVESHLPKPNSVFKSFAKTCKTLRERAES